MPSDSAEIPDSSDRLWRLRWPMAGGAALTLAALGILGVTQDLGFDGALFLWGAAVGVVLNPALVIALAATMTDLDGVRRSSHRRRIVVYSGVWLEAGLIAGTLSALFATPWPDLVAAGYALLVLIVIGAAALLVVRRRRHRDA